MAKKKKIDKMYLLWNETEGFITGPQFDSAEDAVSHIENFGYLNTEYAIFHCEKVSFTNTKMKTVWSPS